MCGIAGMVGSADTAALWRMGDLLRHRGPDDRGVYVDPHNRAGLAHRRLSILDLSTAGHQPMSDLSGRYHLVYNGEIYNYLELREELRTRYAFRTESDSEVLLAAFVTWGPASLDRLIGMFAFAIWDENEGVLFAARDRFGVKPFYFWVGSDGGLLFSSEIRALHEAGVPRVPDQVAWASYLTYGLYDHRELTFWEGVEQLPPGTTLVWRDGRTTFSPWYDLSQRVGEAPDERQVDAVKAEYLELLKDSVRLRFRADVPIGVSLSGGLDSSLLLGLIHAVQGSASTVEAFTFYTGDARYDELPWVRKMLARTRHPHEACLITADEVPGMAKRVQRHQDEPFGGLPTLAYAKVFERARAKDIKVLLDGQGMDEQWAGYEYYAKALAGSRPAEEVAGPVQGSRSKAVRPQCLNAEFRARAGRFEPPAPFGDALRNRQYLDTLFLKLPRALRFNDRVSMMHSVELREPFLDHRLFELALRQPSERKIKQGVHKLTVRQIAQDLLPRGVVEAPKRPLQTPQREWLRGPLREWANACIEGALAGPIGSGLDGAAVRRAWTEYCEGGSDNSFFVWQWINLGLMGD